MKLRRARAKAACRALNGRRWEKLKLEGQVAFSCWVRFVLTLSKRVPEMLLQEIVRMILRVRLKGELVDFDQPIAGAAVSAFQDGRIIAGWHRDEDGGFQVVSGGEAGVLQSKLLGV